MKNWLRVKKPVLTKKQFERLSNIFDNAGQVLFAGAVITPVVSEVDSDSLFGVGSGIVGMMICWLVSIWLAKK